MLADDAKDAPTSVCDDTAPERGGRSTAMVLQRQHRADSAEIKELFRSSRRVTDGPITLRFAPNAHGSPTTFAVIVPRGAMPSAVRRNALRRRITEALRLILHARATTGGAAAITVRSELGDAPLDEILLPLLKKSGILTQ